MIKLFMIVSCGLIAFLNQASAEETTALKTDKEKLSYSIGASIGKNLKKETSEINLEFLIKGLKSAMAGEKLLLQDKDIRLTMGAYQNELRQHAQVSKQQAMDVNKKKGEDFLAANKTKPGILVLPSGVQYKIIKAGSGRLPVDSDTISVNYRGSLIDGSEFDATEPGHPVNLKLAQLIAGWKEAVKLMPVGSKWQIFIPSILGYGERGVGNDIGPNEVLVFELELLEIK
jgi:FKBP-type peptidyl-prolyl cis-trans isomerase FklB